MAEAPRMKIAAQWWPAADAVPGAAIKPVLLLPQ
jgi:hypothetical protein